MIYTQKKKNDKKKSTRIIVQSCYLGEAFYILTNGAYWFSYSLYATFVVNLVFLVLNLRVLFSHRDFCYLVDDCCFAGIIIEGVKVLGDHVTLWCSNLYCCDE